MASGPIRPDELLSLEEYDRRRAGIRADIIRLKTLRRVEVGPWVSVVFENRATVLFQIQEMLRVERISAPDKVLHEIETYSELLPGPGELSGTLFIEITDDAQRREALVRLGGIEKRVAVTLNGRSIPAEDKRPIDPVFERPGQATCVYYLRFRLPVPAREALAGGPVWLRIDHPEYSHAARLNEPLLRELSSDL